MGSASFYGYKNHIAIDTKSKFVKNYQTTPANVHDSQVIGVLVDPDEITLADSAYQHQATPKGAELFTCLKNNCFEFYNTFLNSKTILCT